MIGKIHILILPIILVISIIVVCCILLIPPSDSDIKNNAQPNMSSTEIVYHMPGEHELHDGTWLQWPHNYDENSERNLVERYEESWILMTLALHSGEHVYIIRYDEPEKGRVSEILENRGCNMSQIELYTWKYEDVWVRDNGPIFVFDHQDELHITDWGFNGWGQKYNFVESDKIPTKIGTALNLPVTVVPMIHEGGSIEVDGKGTLMAKRSSILNDNRNPGLSQDDAEVFFQDI